MNSHLLRVALAFFSFLQSSWALEPESTSNCDELKQVVRDCNQFAIELYTRLSAGKATNVFFCPDSISSALAMTYAGANNQTRQQMAEVLHFTLPPAKLHSTFEQLRLSAQSRNDQRGVEFKVANRLWGQSGNRFLPAFLQITRVHYGAELAQVDFAGETQAARESINAWVNKQTDNRIQDLLAPETLSSATRLILTNAVFFKGQWTHEFAKLATKNLPFQIPSGNLISVPMMFQESELRYAAVDDLQIVELPYGKDSQISMLIVLPRKSDGILVLSKQITNNNVEHWCDAIKSQMVQLYLPRFRVSSDFQLKAVLESMGMTLAFDSKQADFSCMSGDEQLCLDSVIHKASLEVNEQGTVATAATAVIAMTKTIEKPKATPVVFCADHPFMLLIRDNRTESILFMGQISVPSE